MHKTVAPSLATTKDYLTQNVNSTEAETLNPLNGKILDSSHRYNQMLVTSVSGTLLDIL